MIYINRLVKKNITAAIKANKVLLIYGARRVGKTVLMKQIAQEFSGKSLWMNGEDATTIRLLEERSIANYKRLFSDIGLLLIDEAHQIPDIGIKLKLMVDEIPGLCIIASGSSALSLLNQTMEPLTGRSFHFPIYPISQAELAFTENHFETVNKLEERLIYGSYPEVLKTENLEEKGRYLQTIVNAYLYKDVLSIEGTRNSPKINDLLTLIAFQTGQEVSNEAVGRQLGLSKNTVEKYLDLLSRIYILFKLGGYSRNLRKEVSKHSKWYFYDNGIRNALIGDFSPLSIRSDTGALWENYLLAERVKKAGNEGETVDFYFWRTYDQQEIAMIEKQGNNLSAYEIKWKNDKAKVPVAWKNAYPDAQWKLINRENYLDWIL